MAAIYESSGKLRVLSQGRWDERRVVVTLGPSGSELAIAFFTEGNAAPNLGFVVPIAGTFCEVDESTTGSFHIKVNNSTKMERGVVTKQWSGVIEMKSEEERSKWVVMYDYLRRATASPSEAAPLLPDHSPNSEELVTLTEKESTVSSSSSSSNQEGTVGAPVSNFTEPHREQQDAIRISGLDPGLPKPDVDAEVNRTEATNSHGCDSGSDNQDRTEAAAPLQVGTATTSAFFESHSESKTDIDIYKADHEIGAPPRVEVVGSLTDFTESFSRREPSLPIAEIALEIRRDEMAADSHSSEPGSIVSPIVSSESTAELMQTRVKSSPKSSHSPRARPLARPRAKSPTRSPQRFLLDQPQLASEDLTSRSITLAESLATSHVQVNHSSLATEDDALFASLATALDESATAGPFQPAENSKDDDVALECNDSKFAARCVELEQAMAAAALEHEKVLQAAWATSAAAAKKKATLAARELQVANERAGAQAAEAEYLREKLTAANGQIAAGAVRLRDAQADKEKLATLLRESQDDNEKMRAAHEHEMGATMYELGNAKVELAVAREQHEEELRKQRALQVGYISVQKQLTSEVEVLRERLQGAAEDNGVLTQQVSLLTFDAISEREKFAEAVKVEELLRSQLTLELDGTKVELEAYKKALAHALSVIVHENTKQAS